MFSLKSIQAITVTIREAVIAIALVAAVGIACEIRHGAKVAAAEHKFELAVAELKLTQATSASQASVVRELPAAQKATAQKVIAAGGRVSENIKGNVTVDTTTRGVADAAKAMCRDPFGTWQVDLATCTMERHERVSVGGTIYVGPDGKTRLADMHYTPISPLSGQPLSSDGIKAEWDFTVVPDQGQRSPWHTRLVGLYDGAPGLGAQWNPISGLIATAGATYAKSDPRALGALGWRLRLPFIDSTIGGSIAATYGRGGLRWKPIVTIELSR